MLVTVYLYNMNTKQTELIREIEQDLDIDIAYLVQDKDTRAEDIDELMEQIDEAINEIEVIYYANAMDYLAEHDQSLTESIELASGMGYTLDKINSELLATLLKQENVRNEIWDYKDRLESAFYNPF